MASLTRLERRDIRELVYNNLEIKKEIIGRDNAVKSKMNDLDKLKSARSPEPQFKPSGEPSNTLRLDSQKKQVLKDVHDIRTTHNQNIEQVVREDLVKENEVLSSVSNRDIHALLDEEIVIQNAHKPNGLYTNKGIDEFLEREGFEPKKDDPNLSKEQQLQQNKADIWNGLERRWAVREKEAERLKDKPFDKNREDIELDPEK